MKAYALHALDVFLLAFIKASAAAALLIAALYFAA